MDSILAVVSDLYFQSRISAAAKLAGRKVRFIASDAAVAEVAGGALALVDLDADLDVVAAIRRLKSQGMEVVAFGPHLDTEARRAARSAGAARVLAKSKFVTELPKIMNDVQSSAGSPDGSKSDALATLAEYGRRMEELAGLLQDPDSAARIYLAPDPHMEEAEAHGDPIILDSADYGAFLAVDSLRVMLRRARGVDSPGSESPAVR